MFDWNKNQRKTQDTEENDGTSWQIFVLPQARHRLATGSPQADRFVGILVKVHFLED